jgi:DNA polymerase-3 subunit delta'
MSAPEPRANPHLFGHRAAEEALLAAVEGGRLHHAWLFAGPPGVGKATLAFRFARFVLSGQGGKTLALPPTEGVFRQVAAGSHPDLLTLAPSRDEEGKTREVPVEAVRGAVGFLRLTPAASGWRVVVVEGADGLNRFAANALLKILEEPPERALLLLTATAPGRLLPTIRSRCRLLTLHPLSSSDFDRALATLAPEPWGSLDPDARARLHELAGGAPGRALELLEGEGLSLADLAEKVVEGAIAAGSEAAFALADQLQAGGERKFGLFFDLLGDSLARSVGGMARAGARGQELLARTELWSRLRQLREETVRLHLDRRQAVLLALAWLKMREE